MVRSQSLEHFSQASALTTLQTHQAAVASLPADVSALMRVVQHLCIYDVVATEFYGVKLSSERQQDIHLRKSSEMLDVVLALDSAPLTQRRRPEHRLAGRCDHYARLLTAMLRAKGIPARARCGFADYFQSGSFEDHWICEVWNEVDQRWVCVDSQLDDVWRKNLRIDFDALDVPRSRFLVAGQAWQLCRSGAQDASAFGISFVDLRGLWYVAGNLVRDVAALNKVEMLPWDVWGAQPPVNSTLDADRLAYFDALAQLTLAPETRFHELATQYQSDSGLCVPQKVFNALRGQIELV